MSGGEVGVAHVKHGHSAVRDDALLDDRLVELANLVGEDPVVGLVCGQRSSEFLHDVIFNLQQSVVSERWRCRNGRLSDAVGENDLVVGREGSGRRNGGGCCRCCRIRCGCSFMPVAPCEEAKLTKRKMKISDRGSGRD